MKSVRYALLMAALLSPVALAAQTGGPGGSMRGSRRMPSVDDEVKRQAEELSLTDTQKTQVKAILQDQRDQMKKLMQDSSTSRDDRWSKMREIHEKASAQIRDLLTDEQKAKYDKMQEDRRKRMQEGRRGNEEAPPAEPQ